MKADLHIHTNFSFDGVSSPKEMVESAVKKGIKCLCITDHGEIKGAIEAMKFGFDKDILIIPGIEIFSTSGHILGINVKKLIPGGLSAEETIRKIRKQGGVAVIPHPFDRPFAFFWGGMEKILTISPDAIETFNASTVRKSSNRKAFNFSKEGDFCFTAGSDAHRKEYVGRGYIEIPENIFSENDLVQAVMEKKAKTSGRHLNLYEILKNSTNVNVKSVVNYYRLRRKGRKEEKILNF